MNPLSAIPESFNVSSKTRECQPANENNKCPHCQKIMVNSWHIKRHVKSVHEKLKPFQCNQCFTKFSTQFSLLRHMAKFHQDSGAKYMLGNVHQNYAKNIAQCGNANENYTSRAQAGNIYGNYTTNIAQVRSVHQSNIANFAQFGNVAQEINGHENYSRNVSQSQITNVQEKKKSLVKVEKIHENVNSLSCHLCGLKLSSNYHLKAHANTVHEKLRPFQCEQCFAKFPNKSNLQRHMATVHEMNASINCHMCHYKFTIQSNLKRHVKYVHENSKPFPCKQCECKYRFNAALQSHVRFVHENFRPFICNWCPATFRDNFSIKRHSNKLHKNEMKNNLHRQNQGAPQNDVILDLTMNKRT